MRGLVLALLIAAACSGAPARPEPGTTAVLRFHVPASDAELWVDGVYYGDGVRRGVRLAPGEHRLEIRHDRYHTWYAEISVKAGEERTVDVDLAEILP